MLNFRSISGHSFLFQGENWLENVLNDLSSVFLGHWLEVDLETTKLQNSKKKTFLRHCEFVEKMFQFCTYLCRYSSWKSRDQWYRYPFKRQPHKIVRHTQRIRRHQATNFLSVFDHFVGLALKGLSNIAFIIAFFFQNILVVTTIEPVTPEQRALLK